MSWWFSRIFLIYLLMVSTFEIRASDRTKIHYLKKDFKLNYQTLKRSYSLSFKENYLRFKIHGKKRGFYVKACNKKVVQAIDHTLYTTLSSLDREALMIPKNRDGKKSLVKGKLVVNDQERAIYQDPSLQPSLGTLHTTLDALMNQAEGQCKK